MLAEAEAWLMALQFTSHSDTQYKIQQTPFLLLHKVARLRIWRKGWKLGSIYCTFSSLYFIIFSR